MRVHFCIFDCLVNRKAWGVVVALVVFALIYVPIGGVVCYAEDDVASMSVDDALSILEGKPVTTASPVPDKEAVEELQVPNNVPMLRSFAPTTGRLNYLKVLGWYDLDAPGIIDPGNYDDFTVAYRKENGLTITYLRFGCYYDSVKEFDINNSTYIWFVPRLHYADRSFFVKELYLSYVYYVTNSGKVYKFVPRINTGDTKSGIFVVNPYFVTNEQGTFYIDNRHEGNPACFASNGALDVAKPELGYYPHAYMTFTAISYNAESATANGYPVPSGTWELTTDFVAPTTSPDATENPSGGDTGGGTGGTSAPPATSDPALGTIDDSINKQMEQDKAQHEETKGLLGSIIDGITSIPDKIIDLLTDALKALFVPSDDFLNNQLQAFGDSFEAMGFLGYPLSRSIDFLTGLSDAGSSDFTFAGYTFMSGGNFTIPSYSLTVGGKSYKLWDNITWSFDDFFNYFPSEVKALLSMFIYLLGGLCVISYALHMARKYFGVILSDNVVLSVFGSLDNTVLDAMVDDLSDEEQYELDWYRKQDKARLDHMELEGFRKSHRRRRGY